MLQWGFRFWLNNLTSCGQDPAFLHLKSQARFICLRAFYLISWDPALTMQALGKKTLINSSVWIQRAKESIISKTRGSFQDKEVQARTQMLGLVLTSCGQWEKAGEALLPAESDGEEYIVYVRCKMYYSRTSDSNGGKVYFLGGEYTCENVDSFWDVVWCNVLI